MNQPSVDPTLFLKIKTIDELANLLGVSYKKHLRYYLYRLHPSFRYLQFDLPKRNGGKRVISAPATSLKIIQRKLSSILYATHRPTSASHAYAHSRGIKSNAGKHVRKKFVLNIDLEDFFGAINFGRVRGLFLNPPYAFPEPVATILAQICCHENKLPQGAPTSPIISNMICGRLDREMRKFCTRLGYEYTRYADDITISTNGNYHLYVARN